MPPPTAAAAAPVPATAARAHQPMGPLRAQTATDQKPYVVKSHDVHLDDEYRGWLAEIKQRYQTSQVKAAVKVNSEALLFNWQLG